MNHYAFQLNIHPLPNCAQIPAYATDGAAAADAYAAVNEPVTIMPGATAIIPLGFAVEVPEGSMLAVTSRSGHSTKGIQIANGPGIVDSDYRGEVGAIVYNGRFELRDHCKGCISDSCARCLYATQKSVFVPNDAEFVVNRGDRICQVALLPVYRIVWNVVDSVSKTDRGTGGFGSTGV